MLLLQLHTYSILLLLQGRWMLWILGHIYLFMLLQGHAYSFMLLFQHRMMLLLIRGCFYFQVVFILSCYTLTSRDITSYKRMLLFPSLFYSFILLLQIHRILLITSGCYYFQIIFISSYYYFKVAICYIL